MPTIQVYLSEKEYMQIVNVSSKSEESVSEYIKKTTMEKVNNNG